MKISNNNQIAFGTGLNSHLIREFKLLNVAEIEQEFKNLGIDTNFKNSKVFSGGTRLVCRILNEIAERYHIPINSLPPAIRVYREWEICDENYTVGTAAFSITDTEKVLKEKKPFIGGSLFFLKPILDCIQVMNLKKEQEHFFKYTSSPHFLSLIFHEWFHNIHFDLIMKKYGYEGECNVLKAKYPKEKPCGLNAINELSEKDIFPETREYLKTYLGSYCVSSNCFPEIFAELMTKITTKSLDDNLNITKNPLDNIPKNLPECIMEFIEETLNI